MNENTNLSQNISPSKDSWTSCGSGFSGLPYTLVATKSYAKVELWINRGTQEENKRIFDNFSSYKELIESEFRNKLEWERLDEGKGSRIAYYLRDVNIYNKDNWKKIVKIIVKSMVDFEKVIKSYIEKALRI